MLSLSLALGCEVQKKILYISSAVFAVLRFRTVAFALIEIHGVHVFATMEVMQHGGSVERERFCQIIHEVLAVWKENLFCKYQIEHCLCAFRVALAVMRYLVQRRHALRVWIFETLLDFTDILESIFPVTCTTSHLAVTLDYLEGMLARDIPPDDPAVETVLMTGVVRREILRATKMVRRMTNEYG